MNCSFSDEKEGGNTATVEKEEMRLCDYNPAVRDVVDIGSRFAGGNGTEDDPYRISNVTQLQDMNLDRNAHYILINNINASETSNWNDGLGFTPIAEDPNFHDGGYQGIKFNGNFFGQNYTIVNLVINRSNEEWVGLFGYVGEDGSIGNVTMVNSVVNGERYVGGLIGYNEGYVENCSTSGHTTGYGIVGGLVGLNVGIVEKSEAAGYFSGKHSVGGLVGWNSGGSVLNCSASGKLTDRGGDSWPGTFGGLAGLNQGRSIVKNCHAIVEIVATGTRIGGLIGDNRARVENCYSKGNVNSNGRCVGGLVGDNEGSIIDSYSTGNVVGEEKVGGIVGISWNGTVSNSFYCINYSTVNGMNYVTPYGMYKTQYDRWIANNKTIDVDEHMIKIEGTDYYNISTVHDLKVMLPFALEKHKFMQISDIDLSLEPNFYIPIFLGGIYEGNGRSMMNLDLTFLNKIRKGVFGFIDNGAVIKNFTVTNCTITGITAIGGFVGEAGIGCFIENCHADSIVSGTREIGGLVGKNAATIKKCTSTGNVTGTDWNVGGFVGMNFGNLKTIEYSCASGNVIGHTLVGGFVGNNNRNDISKNCHATGDVTGIEQIGGFAGHNNGNIRNCYSTGNVTGFGGVGGLIGTNGNLLENCYSTGNVVGVEDTGGLLGYAIVGEEVVRNCFWDVETSGQSYSNGGTGKTTIEMMTKRTFVEAGWDFETIWYMERSRT